MMMVRREDDDGAEGGWRKMAVVPCLIQGRLKGKTLRAAWSP